MNSMNLNDTQPTDPGGGKPTATSPDTSQTQPVSVKPAARPRGVRYLILAFVFLAIALITAAIAGGTFAGYQSGLQSTGQFRTEKFQLSLNEQFELGNRDLAAGRYEVARQRFQYILDADPNYPGLTEKMASVLTILYATATPTPVTPTPVTPTITLTPTRDLRPVQDRFTQILNDLRDNAWSVAIDAIIALRKEEPGFEVTRLDGLLYLSLRQRGVAKIYQESNLEGGIYDLSLAENFGPLDLEAEVARNMARLYLYGSSFWEAYPEKAVFYFGQVAAAAPYLRDASGWTATERYRGALIQYGDQLGKNGDWCAAWEQYQLAASIRVDADLTTRLNNASEGCAPPTATSTGIPSMTPTASVTPTWTVLPPTAAPPTETSVPPTDTVAPPPTDTVAPPPTDTPVPPPTDTPVPPSTDTPASPASDTPNP
jgi:hypothetical protein